VTDYLTTTHVLSLEFVKYVKFNIRQENKSETKILGFVKFFVMSLLESWNHGITASLEYLIHMQHLSSKFHCHSLTERLIMNNSSSTRT